MKLKGNARVIAILLALVILAVVATAAMPALASQGADNRLCSPDYGKCTNAQPSCPDDGNCADGQPCLQDVNNCPVIQPVIVVVIVVVVVEAPPLCQDDVCDCQHDCQDYHRCNDRPCYQE